MERDLRARTASTLVSIAEAHPKRKELSFLEMQILHTASAQHCDRSPSRKTISSWILQYFLRIVSPSVTLMAKKPIPAGTGERGKHAELKVLRPSKI